MIHSFKTMRCVLEFNENTKEVEIKGEKIASELRI